MKPNETPQVKRIAHALAAVFAFAGALSVSGAAFAQAFPAVQATRAPDFVKRMTDLGYNIIPGTLEQMASMLKEEIARWSPIVKASGAKVD